MKHNIKNYLLDLNEQKKWGKKLKIYSDSQLIVNQVKSKYQAKEDKMMEYFGKVKGLLESFMEYTVTQISKEENSKAYALTRSASTLTQA